MFESLTEKLRRDLRPAQQPRHDQRERPRRGDARGAAWRCSKPTSTSRSCASSSPRARAGARRRGAEEPDAPQQVIGIVNEELVELLGGEPGARQPRRHSRRPSSCSSACRAPARRRLRQARAAPAQAAARSRCWSPPTSTGPPRSSSCSRSASSSACPVFAEGTDGKPARSARHALDGGAAQSARPCHRRHGRPPARRRDDDERDRPRCAPRSSRRKCSSSPTRWPARTP